MAFFDDLIEKVRNEAQTILSPGGTFSINPCGDGEKNVSETVRVEITALDGKAEVRTLTCSEVANLVALAKAFSEAVGEAAG